MCFRLELDSDPILEWCPGKYQNQTMNENNFCGEPRGLHFFGLPPKSSPVGDSHFKYLFLSILKQVLNSLEPMCKCEH